MTHPVQWTAAAPLWDEAATSSDGEIRGMFGQPSILRFATDSFMDDFLAMIATSPSRLGELVAQPETWRDAFPPARREGLDATASFARSVARFRLPGGRPRRLPAETRSAVALLSKPDPDAVLKLYQPAHQRYYLVVTSLVCTQPGLPDRALEGGRVSFVMRRLMPRVDGGRVVPHDPGSYDEYALVTTADGTGWQKVKRASAPHAGIVVPGEDQLPLFPATYTQDDGRRRRLLAGMIPVGRREAYLGGMPIPLAAKEMAAAPALPAAADDEAPTVPGKPPLGPRETLIRSQATEPWKQLIARAAMVKATLDESREKADEEGENIDAVQREHLKIARENIQTASWYVLLDFASYLRQYMPVVWAALPTGQPPQGALSPKESDLVVALRRTVVNGDLTGELAKGQGQPPRPVNDSLARALLDIVNPTTAQDLEAVTSAYERDQTSPKWPPFLFPLADPEHENALVTVPHLDGDAARAVNMLAALIDSALRPDPQAKVPHRALGAQPIAGLGEPGWFVIRCVYDRPECSPLAPPVLSAPTRVFQLAGFFDPDAPARPIRIALPIDTTPAGLRKFDKNTAFMMSDILCGQISKVRSLTLGDLVLSVLPWPFHKDLPSLGGFGPCKTGSEALGMVCSLSIPIITICALILLMIIVSLLDLIFRWMPFFFICFPLPKFRGKET